MQWKNVLIMICAQTSLSFAARASVYRSLNPLPAQSPEPAPYSYDEDYQPNSPSVANPRSYPHKTSKRVSLDVDESFYLDMNQPEEDEYAKVIGWSGFNSAATIPPNYVPEKRLCKCSLKYSPICAFDGRAYKTFSNRNCFKNCATPGTQQMGGGRCPPQLEFPIDL